jgi:hypothetical protein
MELNIVGARRRLYRLTVPFRAAGLWAYTAPDVQWNVPDLAVWVAFATLMLCQRMRYVEYIRDKKTMLKRTRWQKLTRGLPYLRCLLPWNCVVGFFLFYRLVGWLFEALHVHDGILKAVGLAFVILAIRQLRLSKSAIASSDRRHTAASLLLACGYSCLGFLTCFEPHQFRLPGWFLLFLLLIGIISCLGSLIVGRAAVASSCARI